LPRCCEGKKQSYSQREGKESRRLLGEREKATVLESLEREGGLLEAEGSNREEYFIAALKFIEGMKKQMGNSGALIAQLREAVSNPEPGVCFGEKRQHYSAKVFRFGAKLLNCKMTFQFMVSFIRSTKGAFHRGSSLRRSGSSCMRFVAGPSRSVCKINATVSILLTTSLQRASL